MGSSIPGKDKGLTFIIYKELWQINKEKTNSPTDPGAKYKLGQTAKESYVAQQLVRQSLISPRIIESEVETNTYPSLLETD